MEKKKRNPADITQRNLVPLRRDIAKLKAIVRELQDDIKKLKRKK